ncbi:MAG TPA: pyridoxal 5'-phosphate synthase glutaminase subunit PdxT [Myxococcota bacterium]|nr:pyridoxal 5'-phosphate synthase glutaminase subunit PdxT [Myxococcota bacterium]
MEAGPARRIGVLALQGGYEAHERILRELGKEVVRVKTPADLAQSGAGGLDGLVLPGGESSTMLKLIAWNGLEGPLDAFVRAGRPVFATCAGLILAATGVSHPEQRSFGWLDVDVSRNAWGRQNESFEALDDAGRFRMVFIRAPRITRVGDGVDVVATYKGEAVAVRSRSLPVVAATFHPELAGEPGLHRLAFG